MHLHDGGRERDRENDRAAIDLLFDKLQKQKQRIEQECNEIELRMKHKGVSHHLKKVLRDKLSQLKGAVLEIEKLQQRLKRL